MVTSLQSPLYTWSVLDVDGHSLREDQIVDGPGWGRVNLERTPMLWLQRRGEYMSRIIVRARLDQGERLFFTRRHTINLAPDASGKPTITTIAGTQRADGSGSYTFLFEDGSILVSTDLNAV